MLYLFLANTVLFIHLLFILFVLLGGLLLFKWRGLVWIHLPCAVWGILLEFNRWICPLTYLENDLRRMAGAAGYDGGFIQHYLLAIIYPASLSADLQLLLGGFTVLVNLCIYVLLIKYHFQHTGTGKSH